VLLYGHPVRTCSDLVANFLDLSSQYFFCKKAVARCIMMGCLFKTRNKALGARHLFIEGRALALTCLPKVTYIGITTLFLLREILHVPPHLSAYLSFWSTKMLTKETLLALLQPILPIPWWLPRLCTTSLLWLAMDLSGLLWIECVVGSILLACILSCRSHRELPSRSLLGGCVFTGLVGPGLHLVAGVIALSLKGPCPSLRPRSRVPCRLFLDLRGVLSYTYL